MWEAVPGVPDEWRTFITINDREMSFEKLENTSLQSEAENKEFNIHRREQQPLAQNRDNQELKKNNQRRSTSARYAT